MLLSNAEPIHVALIIDAWLLGSCHAVRFTGPEQGLVLALSIWLAEAELIPWEPRFEIEHRRVVQDAEFVAHLWAAMIRCRFSAPSRSSHLKRSPMNLRRQETKTHSQLKIHTNLGPMKIASAVALTSFPVRT
jgi:hypothetical protein